MKQLRLISHTENQADFNVLFQEPILIKPNSTIGLQNFSLFFDDNMIEVNDDNNSFTMEFFDVDDNTTKLFGKFQLTNGTYNPTTFINELNAQLNKGLANLSSSFGGELIQSANPNYMEVSCILEKITKNLSITYALQTADTNPSYLEPQFINFDGTSTYTKNGASTYDWAYAYTAKTSCEGQSIMSLKTSNSGGTTTGIAMGFINLNTLSPQALIGNGLDPSLYEFCVFNDDGTFWKIKNIGGNITTTTFPVTDMDVITISKGAYSTSLTDETDFNTFGYKITLQSDPSVSYTLAQIPFNYGEQYHGAFSIRDTTSGITNFTFTPSPSNVSDKYGSGIHIIKDFRLLEKNNYYSKQIGGEPDAPYQKLFLSLGDNAAKLLGFVNPVTNSITGATGAWDADISIYATVIPSSIIIELPNTHFHSYDGDVYYKRRRNILAIVPAVNLEQENTKITYQPHFPVMLDMLNRNEELMTNIRVRVLDLDNVPLRINQNKGCSLSVLLQ